MDEKEELERAKWLLGSIAIFVVSCFFVYDEFAFQVWGREVEATVTKAYEVTKGGKFGMGGSQRLDVDFTFSEPGGLFRRGTDTVRPDWPLPRTGTVTVEYTPGELGRARLKGHTYWGQVMFFGVSLAVVAVFAFMLWREANEELKPRKKRQK